MNILTPNRGQLPQPIANALDKILSAISGVWSVEHHDDGTHGNITADSLTVAAVSASKVGNITGSLVPTSAAGELGTVLPNIPGATGPFLAWLALHVTTIYFETFRSTPSAAVVRRPRMTSAAFTNDSNSSDFTWTLSDNIGNTHTLTIGNGLAGLTSNRTIQGSFVYSTSDVQADTGVLERSRSARMGDWTTFSPTQTASTGTWTGSTITTAQYMLVGKTLFVNVVIDAGNNSNATAQLRIAIPGGFTSAKFVQSQNVRALDLGAAIDGVFAEVTAAGTTINFAKFDGTNWAVNAANGNYVRATFRFEVQ